MPPKAAGGGKKSKAAKAVTNKRRRGFIDPDLRVSKRQERKDDESQAERMAQGFRRKINNALMTNAERRILLEQVDLGSAG